MISERENLRGVYSMKIKVFASTMLAIVGWQTASAVEVSWYRQPGSALSIAGSASGSLWIAGTDRENANGYFVYKWNGKDNFAKDSVVVPGKRLAVTGNDQLWLVDDQQVLWGQLQAGNALFYLRKARDVVTGPDNSIWIVSTEAQTGGYQVYQRSDSNNWNNANFAAVNIAVDKSGNIWAVNDSGQISLYNAASKTWSSVKAPAAGARSISIGSSSDNVWLLGSASTPGGFPIFQWNSSTRSWEPYGPYGAVQITEAAGRPWIVQSDGKVYSKADPSKLPVPTDLTQTWPAETPQPMEPIRATQSGKLLCAATPTGSDCTDKNTNADYVGKYTFVPVCAKGFFDPIFGGSCWQCPPGYDGWGDYIRSATPVNSDTACWRDPSEHFSRATLVKAPVPFAWDCPSGSFWDGYSPNGPTGSCWKCPDTYPRRTGYSVFDSNACVTPTNQTTRALFLNYTGCARPDATTMNLPGKRSPGQPFVDLAAGGNASGSCWACPITDESGNFLITDRNTTALYGDTNTGCTIKLKWQPASYYDPGLAYMYGVKDVIWEQRLFDGTRLTGFLYDQAEALGLGDATPAAKTWVAARWQEIAANPYNSAQFRAWIFDLLKGALKKDRAIRTRGEQALIKTFALYIQQRRTYLAQQALAMYDAWKNNDDLYRAYTGQGMQLSSLFYYGTVPLDFQGTLSGLMGLSSVGGGTVGALVAANIWGKGAVLADTASDIGYAREIEAFEVLDDLSLLRTVEGAALASGSSIVATAAAILGSIAIDQFMAIETARPKLQAALAQAQKNVDLDQLMALANGADQMYLFWSKAMDATDVEDPQVIQLAAIAQVRAEQSGYAAPPKSAYLIPGKTTDRLISGTGAINGYLQQNQKLVSKSGAYEVDMQLDGNLVIYTASRQAIWATGTNGKGTSPFEAAMQANGTLAVFDSTSLLWSTAGKTGTAPYTLLMQDDGNLVVYDSLNTEIWASGTKR